ncbi:hypothetical protein DFH08DRAFT_815497 [Mycena albidolilacea]|uniref:Uncharacterized protein n=1 Tax=Mycena albidolilacea TaxID=1033008 RepID=A0AAD6ZMR5_9AGAR|nr:hypothetical protein DFH08DRAFT_815497 [Mycena albidolilacea]
MNILKGLDCTATMVENIALALYGVCVSWPYMAMVRNTKQNPINLLSLTDLHRKIPEFCSHIAANPKILLDPTAPIEELTIDGKPFLDNFLINTIWQLALKMSNLLLTISAMFSGAADRWVHFTPEFHVDGTFDRLTLEQRAILFILSTNDCNEGLLGSYRVHMCYHSNSTPQSFSNQTRAEQNNTKAFIKKVCNAAVQKFVMREVRKDGKSGAWAKFRKAWAALQREKAEKGLEQWEKVVKKKKKHQLRLATMPLELEISAINAMTSAWLKDQLQDMTTVTVRRQLVLEAQERELACRPQDSGSTHLSLDPPSTDDSHEMVVEEYGFSLEDDADCVDVSD